MILEYLQQARQEAGINQQQLADVIDRDRRYISDLECGKRSVPQQEAEMIADYLGYRVSDLL